MKSSPLAYHVEIKSLMSFQDMVLIHNQSGMSTSIVNDTEHYHTRAMLQFGIPHTYFMVALTKKFEAAKTKLRGCVK